jgi:hypothetical protein
MFLEKGRPAQLTLSPSDSALNASVKAVIDSQELDEERATMSEVCCNDWCVYDVGYTDFDSRARPMRLRLCGVDFLDGPLNHLYPERIKKRIRANVHLTQPPPVGIPKRSSHRYPPVPRPVQKLPSIRV